MINILLFNHLHKSENSFTVKKLVCLKSYSVSKQILHLTMYIIANFRIL